MARFHAALPKLMHRRASRERRDAKHSGSTFRWHHAKITDNYESIISLKQYTMVPFSPGNRCFAQSEAEFEVTPAASPSWLTRLARVLAWFGRRHIHRRQGVKKWVTR